MPRFYIGRDEIVDGMVAVKGEDVNHICNVLRMKPGDGLLLCDGEGILYDATIREAAPGRVVCYITKEGLADTELPGRIILFQGLPKKDKMDLIVQKAVELGASEIIPVRMKRTIVKLEDAKKEEKKLLRWRSICEGAAKQSGRGCIPAVGEVLDFPEALAKAGGIAYNMIPYEKAENMAESLETFREAAKMPEIGIFIGPEGGFDPQEYEAALAAGVRPVSLGKRILRTETAGLAALSILMLLMEAEALGMGGR